ncbi:unnamed protein product [Vicia faba]|uniref:HMA domain-containing protein n=1 Tax=Vicia faba TaxID=3906 RepID=A0AAV1A276_VICFA|nr:unnamed protein product [Vicia faba]
MKKVVLKLEINKNKIKKKAMKAVLGLSGVESFSMDMKEKKLTLIGNIDPGKVVAKLRKFCQAEIISVGPAKEEKKDEPKDSTNVNYINPMFYGADSIEEKLHPNSNFSFDNHYKISCVLPRDSHSVLCVKLLHPINFQNYREGLGKHSRRIRAKTRENRKISEKFSAYSRR